MIPTECGGEGPGGDQLGVCRQNPQQATQCDTSKDTACATTVCDSQDGLCKPVLAPPDTPCQDGDPCSVDSSCKAGKCVAGSASWCQCTAQADCQASEDGNLCTGTLYCDLASFPWTCKVKPQTVVTCSPVDDSACAANTCDPDSGKCALKPHKNGTPCDDSDATTIGDACKNGVCAAGIVPPCKQDPDCDVQEDGNLCNGTLFCDKGTGNCIVNPITVIACKIVGDTACRSNTCDPQTGACTPQAHKNGSACDDGDSCTGGDACVAGECKAGATFLCACSNDSDCESYDDGDLCNGVFYCNKANKNCEFNPATKVLCHTVDDTACRKNACHAKVGACKLTAAGAVTKSCDLPPGADGKPGCRQVATQLANPVTVLCDDGNPCTAGDVCDGLVCAAGTTKICECQTDADCLVQDDGDRCNGVPFCDKTAKVPTCKPNPGSVVYCPAKDDTACLRNRCDAKTGNCGFRPEKTGSACEDGEPCTTGDGCANGACVGGPANACDDGDGCTQDLCDKGVGCKHPSQCNDGNGCTADTCDPATGKCAFSAAKLNDKTCDADGDGCTINDACKAGLCTAGPYVQCSVPLAKCQVAACVGTSAKTFSCVAKVQDDGASCDDGDPCSVGDRCTAGKCQAGADDKLYVADLAGLATGTRLESVVSLGGDVAVAGPLLNDQGKARGWAVARIGEDRQVAWQHQLVVQDAALADGSRPVGVWRGGAGDVVVAGNFAVGKALVPRVVTWSGDGKKVLGAWSYTEVGGVRISAAAPSIGGVVFLIGAFEQAGEQLTLIARVSDGGAPLSKATVGGARIATASTARKAGGIAIVGTQLGKSEPALLTTKADGSHDCANRIGELLTMTGIVDLGGAYAVSGTAKGSDGQPSPVVGRIDGACGLDFQRFAQLTGHGAGLGLVDAGGDMLVMLGTRGAAKSVVPAVFGVSASAMAPGWERKWDALATGRWSAGTVLGDGTILLVGSREQGGSGALIGRLDAWGHTSCSSAGPCALESAAKCDDSNPCTNDLCEAKPTSGGNLVAGCVHVQHTDFCDDGDACALIDKCAAGKCAGLKARDCDDSSACTEDACNGKTGCTHKKLTGVQCPDDDACTLNETCVDGACKSQPLDCDDGDACTTDACEKTGGTGGKGGCTHAPDTTKCDDGNVCTKDVCAKKSGCGTVSLDGAPCDDGNPCTEGDACAKKACVAGDGKLFSLADAVIAFGAKVPSQEAMRIHGMALADDGDVLIAKLSQGGGAVGRYSPTGKKRWGVAPFVSFNIHQYEAAVFRAVAPGPANGSVVVGAQGFGNHVFAAVYRLDASGKVLGAKLHGDERTLHAEPRIVRLARGGYAIADRSSYHIDGPWSANLWAIDDGGGQRWMRQLGTPTTNALLQDVAAVSDGGLIALQEHGDIWTVARYNDLGDVLWQRDAGAGSPARIVARAGEFWLAGSAGADAAERTWLWRLDGVGNTKARLTLPSTSQDNPQGLATLPAGGVVVTGHDPDSKGRERCKLTVVGDDGQVRWTRSYAITPAGVDAVNDGGDRCTAVIARADGSITAAGTTVIDTVSAYNRLWLLRVNPWGQSSCAQAGKCAALKADACEDDDTCTTDLCDPEKGCQNAENSAPCDDSNSCTGAGRCKEGSCKPGTARLFDATYGDELHDRPARVVPLTDGRLLSFENHGNDKGWPGVISDTNLRLVGADGTEHSVARTTPIDGGQASRYAVADDVDVLDDGSVLVTGRSQVGGTHNGTVLPMGASWSFRADGTLRAGDTFHYTSKAPYLSSHIACQGGDGLMLAVGASAAGSYYTVATRMDRLGEQVKNMALIEQIAPPGYVDDCVWTTAGDFVVAGHTVKAGAPLTLQRVALTADGNIGGGSLRTVYGGGDPKVADPPTDATIPVKLLARPGGGTLVVARTQSFGAGGWDAWLLAVDAKLKATWQRAIGTADNEQVLGATQAYTPGDRVAGGRVLNPSPRADLLLWGAQWPKGAAKSGFLWRLDHRGRQLWQRKWAAAKDDALTDVSILPGGELLLAGTTQSKGKGGDDLWLLRADPWGATTCALAGVCLATTATECDDDDPCTADVCDAKAGCTHREVPGACGERPSCTERFAQSDGTPDWVNPPAEQFERILGATEADVVTDVAEVNGQIVTVGALGSDGVVAAHDSEGTVVWRRQDKASAPLVYASIAVHRDNAVVAGYSAAADLGGAGGGGGGGGNDGLLMMVDERGGRTWRTGVGGGDDDRFADVAWAKAAGWVAVGRTRSDAAGGWDGWVVAADDGGAVRWQLRLGGGKNDALNGVAVSGDGLVAAGYTASKGNGGTDGWLVRVDNTGKLLADVAVGSNKDDALNAVVVDAKGGVAAVGSTLQQGGGDGWLLRTNKAFATVQNVARGHALLPDELRDIVQLSSGRLAVVGSRNSDGAKSEGWLLLLDDADKPLSEHIFSKPTDDRLSGIAALKHGGFGLAGTIDDGAKGTDGWLLRTNPWGYVDCEAAGKCAWSGPALCDDGIACTVDACDPKLGCTHTGDVAPCAELLNEGQPPAASCAAILAANDAAKSGRYVIKPDYNNTKPTAVYCDMETAGGGWTLFLAMRPDTPSSWTVIKWLGSHLEPDKLAYQGIGDVHTNGVLSRDMTQAIGHSGAMEYLIDTGAGLFVARYAKKNVHGYLLDAFGALYSPTAATALLQQFAFAPDEHTPAPQAIWSSVALRVHGREGCPHPYYECIDLPADAAGRFQQTHIRDGAPAAGFDGSRRHAVRVFIR